MTIILLVFALCLLFGLGGWGLKRIFDPKGVLPPGFSLSIGYASMVAIFHACYLLSESTSVSTIVAVTVPLMASLLCAIAFKSELFADFKDLKNSQVSTVWSLFALVILVASATYLYAGLGQYWHTANEDVFDGLHGRNAIMHEELLGTESEIDVAVRFPNELTRSLYEEQEIYQEEITPEYLKSRYLDNLGFLQYSSLAFFSELLSLPKGMDAFLFQSLVNLGLFFLGVLACARVLFSLPFNYAISAALLGALGQFYFVTYLNGHIGSMMFNSVLPFLLLLTLKSASELGSKYAKPVLCTIFLIFIIGAYPFPLPFIVAPLILLYLIREYDSYFHYGYTLFNRYPLALKIGIILAIVGLTFITIYILVEPIRERALQQYRSWGTILNHIGFLQFWGIWPSGLANTPTPLSLLDNLPAIKELSLLLATILSGLTIYGVVASVKQKHYFIAVLAPVFVCIYILMRFAIYDSYYNYKFLYIYAWIIYILLLLGVKRLFEKGGLLRLSTIVVMVLWGGANLANNLSAQAQIASLPYNAAYKEYAEILSVSPDTLRHSYISIPQLDRSEVLRQILIENGFEISTEKDVARYFIQEKGQRDILVEQTGDEVWSGKRLEIVASPGHDVPQLASYWSVSYWNANGNEEVFLWVSDGRNGTIKLDLHHESGNLTHLFLCGESGPSVDFRTVPLRVEDAEGNFAGQIDIGNYDCHTLDISDLKPPFEFTHDEVGHYASYVDLRKLIYRIMYIGFQDAPLVASRFYEAYETNDILSLSESLEMSTRLSIGDNWYGLESFAGENFRWARPDAEILITTAQDLALSFEIATGPSSGLTPLIVTFSYESGETIGSCEVIGRSSCEIPVEAQRAEPFKLILDSNALGQVIEEDPRILNYRVLSIVAEEAEND